MSKYYAVAIGRNPGIYRTWEETSQNVTGYPGAKFKSFPSYSDALSFLQSYSQPLIQTQLPPIIVPSPQLQPNNSIIAYTDGSSRNGIGGYGVVILSTGTPRELSGRVPSEAPVTNNIAELYAIWVAVLNTPKDLPLLIRTDSEYSMNIFTKYLPQWIQRNWKTTDNRPVINRELIEAISEAMKDRIIHFEHIYSHTGDFYNEKADQLAKSGL